MIHHVALFARNPARLASFYEAVLNLTEIRRNEDEDGLYSVWLGAGESILMLERADAGPPGDAEAAADPAAGAADDAAAGLRPVRHCLLAFALQSTEEQAFRDRLRRAGGFISRRTESTLYFSDPEGNRAAVSWYSLVK